MPSRLQMSIQFVYNDIMLYNTSDAENLPFLPMVIKRTCVYKTYIYNLRGVVVGEHAELVAEEEGHEAQVEHQPPQQRRQQRRQKRAHLVHTHTHTLYTYI